GFPGASHARTVRGWARQRNLRDSQMAGLSQGRWKTEWGIHITTNRRHACHLGAAALVPPPSISTSTVAGWKMGKMGRHFFGPKACPPSPISAYFGQSPTVELRWPHRLSADGTAHRHSRRQEEQLHRSQCVEPGDHAGMEKHGDVERAAAGRDYPPGRQS